MDVSIIIVSYNSIDFIKSCIESIDSGFGKEGIEYEILVVDNNSDDGSQEFLSGTGGKNKNLKLVLNKSNTGFSGASNTGALMAQGRYLLFLNPDTKFLSNNFKDLIGFYNSRDKIERIGFAGAKILNPDRSLQYSPRSFPTLARQFYESYFLSRIFKKSYIFGSYFLSWWDHSSIREVDWLSGSFLFIKKDYFLQAGMFCEDYFMFSEDAEICLKLHRQNFKNYYFPDLVIEHYDSGISSRDLALREARIWNSRRLYFKRNYSDIHAIIVSLLYLAGILNRIALFSIMSLFKPHSFYRHRLLSYFRTLKLYYGKKV
jgi:GT2 family glycosyltransferase